MLRFWLICLPRSRSSPGRYRPAEWAAGARALDPMRAPVWGRAGTGWRLPDSVGLVPFGGLAGLGVRSGRLHEGGITHRSSSFEAIGISGDPLVAAGLGSWAGWRRSW